MEQPADRQIYLANLVALLNSRWPDNRTVHIVCHGHSVPAGYFQTPVVESFNAYPHLLHVRLKERHPWSVINVIVTAIGGGRIPTRRRALRPGRTATATGRAAD